MFEYTTPVPLRSKITKWDLPPTCTVSQTCTEPPSPAMVYCTQSSLRAPPWSLLILTRPSTLCNRNLKSCPNNSWHQWLTVRLRWALAKRRRNPLWRSVGYDFPVGFLPCNPFWLDFDKPFHCYLAPLLFCHSSRRDSANLVLPRWANKINRRSWRTTIFLARPRYFPRVTSLVLWYKNSTAYPAFKLTPIFRDMSQTLMPPVLSPTISVSSYWVGLTWLNAQIQQDTDKLICCTIINHLKFGVFCQFPSIPQQMHFTW